MTLRLTHCLWAIILFFLLQTINATNYYWIGGAGNWSDINHWATTSGGSTLHSFVPTPSDDVFFDAGSGFTVSSNTVTINTNATCLNMTWSGALNNPSLYSFGQYNKYTWLFVASSWYDVYGNVHKFNVEFGRANNNNKWRKPRRWLVLF